jgi:hypothetical protein
MQHISVTGLRRITEYGCNFDSVIMLTYADYCSLVRNWKISKIRRKLYFLRGKMRKRTLTVSGRTFVFRTRSLKFEVQGTDGGFAETEKV